MAPRGPTKARDYDYSNVGKTGRRTGITLKEGKRDEHGMEDIEGMWSSPERSPSPDNGVNDMNDASIGSDGMSMDEDNALGPADFLGGVNGSRGSYHLPPVARSPMKSGLTGSPRRTPGLRSSQSPQPDILSSSPSDGKSLGNTKGDSRQDVSPLTNRSINAPSLNGTRTKGNKTSEPPIPLTFSDSDANSPFNGDENAGIFEQIQNEFVDSFNTNNNAIEGDQREEIGQNGVGEDSHSIVSPQLYAHKSAKTVAKPRRNAQDEEGGEEDTVRRNVAKVQEPSQKRKRPGRPPKSQAKAKDDTEEQRPSKKTKTFNQAPEDRNSSGHPELEQVVESYVNRTGPLKGRGLYILKREEPTGSSATHTRSGRVSIAKNTSMLGKRKEEFYMDTYGNGTQRSRQVQKMRK
ncbi:hypothetical protein EYZ11_011467 [Aspergillus tanneri]|uniref:Mif2 N-terminal domain-containing protein n=1 Tax=Aspergillus tanneri TaxID=1220188 RepID=A0A4S3J2Q9_9EURO|nr:hypothetical protein EYZ11_011467 [Aspergillus tanneri]